MGETNLKTQAEEAFKEIEDQDVDDDLSAEDAIVFIGGFARKRLPEGTTINVTQGPAEIGRGDTYDGILGNGWDVTHNVDELNGVLNIRISPRNSR